MDSKISNLLKILKLILKWRMSENEKRKEDYIIEMKSLSIQFFEKTFIEHFENNLNFLNMFEAMIINELEKINCLLENFIALSYS